MASAQGISPAVAAEGDFVRQWTAPDGRPMKLVVKLPRPDARASVFTIDPIPASDDARPVFDNALAAAREHGAARLRIAPGTYVFRSTAKGAVAHWLIQGVSDLTIQADGVRLVFTADAPGVVINTSQRIRLVGATLSYALTTSSLATVQLVEGRQQLVLDSNFASGDPAKSFYLTEYDRSRRQWVIGGQRLILPPGSPDAATRVAQGVYGSNAFRNLKPGASFAVFHQWYGGAALKVDDVPGPRQTEDVVLQDITIHNAPGMGFLIYGLKRGLALLGSRVMPDPATRAPVSTNFDAVHIQSGGGDLLIADNLFTGQGDDGINLNNPMHPVVSVGEGGRSLVLSTYSRFIRAGDRLAFFSGQGRFLGTAEVLAPPVPLGGLNHRVAISRAIEGLDNQTVVRDLALLASRYVVEGNTIERCHCHGVLAQLPNGLIRGNTFSWLTYNAIRLLTDVGPWREGVGAINVAVRDNTISDTGPDQAPAMPWAAIAAYGTGKGGGLVDEPVNQHLEISGNTIQRVQQACITVASSQNVTVSRNLCRNSNLNKRRSDSLNVLRASAVRLGTNTLDGGVWVDGGSTRQVSSTPAER